MMIKVSTERFDKLLVEEIPSDYKTRHIKNLIDEFNDTSTRRLLPDMFVYDPVYERYSKNR